jgi:purine-binding chemotaxis protein CheW
MKNLQIAVFRLNDQTFGINTTQVSEIISCNDVLDCLKDYEFSEKIIKIRDIDTAIVSMNKRMGLGDDIITEKSKVIVGNNTATPVGIIANDVLGVLSIENENVKEIPPIVRNDNNTFLDYVCINKDELFYIINIEKILSANEYEEFVIKNADDKDDVSYAQ